MNIFDTPEAFGLNIVATLETASGAYEFDTIVVFRNQEGKKFWLRDSGCSCPYPFQGMDTFDLIPLDVATLRLEPMGCATPREVQEFFEEIR